MIKILRKIGIVILSLIVLFLLTVILFVNFSPEFGGSVNKKQKAIYVKSDNYEEGKFINQQNVSLDMTFGDMRKSLVGYFNPLPNTIPIII